MTRIPPSITNVFKRITHSKRPADRNPTTMAAQPAPQQKTVRFAEENQVIPSHNALGHHDNRLVHGAPLAPSQERASSASPHAPEPGALPQAAKDETEVDGQQILEARSGSSRSARAPNAPPPEHPIKPPIQDELERLMAELEKKQDDSSSRTEGHNAQFLRISGSIDKKNRMETKKVVPSAALDDFFAAYEKENNIPAATNNISSEKILSTQEMNDAILEIKARQITEKQV